MFKQLSSVHKKVQSISLLDPAFFKALESALRFGTALIVQDVEGSVDPIINPVLNREFSKVRTIELLRGGVKCHSSSNAIG